MPEPTPDIITAREALAYGKKEVIAPASIAPEQKKAQEKANTLMKLRDESRSPIDRISENASKKGFSPADGEILVSKFGANEAKINEITHQAEIKPDAPTDARENFDLGKKAVENVTTILAYTQILKDAAREGKNPRDIYAISPYNFTDSDWTSLRASSLNLLLTDGGILNGFSEELAGLTPQQQAEYIDAVLATDPSLNTNIARELQTIQEDADKLPSIKNSTERTALSTTESKLTTDIQTNFDLIFTRLGLDASLPENVTLKALIAKQIEAGVNPSEIQDTFFVELCKKAAIPDIGDLNEYDIATTSLLDKDVRIATATVSKHALDQVPTKNLTNPEQAQVRALGADLVRLNNERQSVMTTLQKKIADIGLPQAEIDVKLRQMKAIDRQVYGDVNADGTRRGGIGDTTNRLITKYQELGTTKEGIAKTDSTQEATRERSARLQKETELITNLQSILPKAIADVLTDRMSELNIHESTRLRRAIAEENKKGNTWSEEALKKLLDAQSKRWIEYSPRERKNEIHGNTIKEDVATLAANGDTGAKEIFAGIVGHTLDDASLKNEISNADFGGMTYSALSDEEKTKVNEKFQRYRDNFNTLYAANGDKFKQKLLQDFFAARGKFGNRIQTLLGSKEFALTNDQWQKLNENFGPLMESGLNSSKDAQKAIKDLREKGIMPDTKMRWLIWILLGTLGAATGAGGAIAFGAGTAMASAGGLAGAGIGSTPAIRSRFS